jgi:glucosamine 6-phosphate synthetase-like amidotransferase/phosphosugar isomerase protein
MCGIFGAISNSEVNKKHLKILVNHSKQRGKDSSGLIYIENDTFKINRADYDIDKLLDNVKPYKSIVIMIRE